MFLFSASLPAHDWCRDTAGTYACKYAGKATVCTTHCPIRICQSGFYRPNSPGRSSGCATRQRKRAEGRSPTLSPHPSDFTHRGRLGGPPSAKPPLLSVADFIVKRTPMTRPGRNPRTSLSRMPTEEASRLGAHARQARLLEGCRLGHERRWSLPNKAASSHHPREVWVCTAWHSFHNSIVNL